MQALLGRDTWKPTKVTVFSQLLRRPNGTAISPAPLALWTNLERIQTKNCFPHLRTTLTMFYIASCPNLKTPVTTFVNVRTI